jgi:hypothetical protein
MTLLPEAACCVCARSDASRSLLPAWQGWWTRGHVITASSAPLAELSQCSSDDMHTERSCKRLHCCRMQLVNRVVCFISFMRCHTCSCPDADASAGRLALSGGDSSLLVAATPGSIASWDTPPGALTAALPRPPAAPSMAAISGHMFRAH